MTPRQRVLAALHRQPVDRIPYCEHLFDVHVAAEIAGGIERLTDNQQAIQMFRDDDPRTQSRAGFLIEPDISRVVRRDNITYWGALHPFPGPELYLLHPDQGHLGHSADGILKTRDDLAKMVFRELDDQFWAPARAFVENKGDFAACAMVFLGVDPAWHSMGFEHFATSLALDPALVETTLERLTDWLAEVAEGLCALDFDFIWAADDIAYNTAPMFSPRMYRDVLLPHTRKVAENITKPWIFHSDGNLVPILDDLLTQGMNALHPLEPGAMDPGLLKREYGDWLAFVGNINLDTLTRGTPEEVRREVRERIAQMGPDYGYLLSSSNSITRDCKPENVMAMLDALQEFGHYPLVSPDFRPGFGTNRCTSH
ncbi:MAG: uroporphyrinogen decarboxylase family protein [Chloroflexota bacterium]